MLSQFSSCAIPLIILVCCLSVNDAIPVDPHPAGEVRPTASLQSHASDSTRKTLPIAGPPQSITGTPKSVKARRQNSNFNNNINVNYMNAGPLIPAGNNLQSPKKPAIKSNSKGDYESGRSDGSNSNSPKDSVPEPVTKKVSEKKEERPEKCVNEARRQNQTYTRSFPTNTSSIDLAEAFKIAGEAEAKKSSSIHVGEDIALCWIETTTIKEDPAFDPPKRLVIREFTISFENSATIPDNYLECDKLEGEIASGDVETIGKTSLNEMIDENTKRSRVVNFTRVHHIGPILVSQHKKVRCAVGAVVSKDIYEWPDTTDNPKKRVEIKVGPSIRDLGTGTHQESAECATESTSKKPKTDQSSSASSDCSSSETCEISAKCEDDEDCNGPSTVSACEGDDCSAESSSDKNVPTTYPPDSNDLLSTGVTRGTATEVPGEVPFDSNDLLSTGVTRRSPTNEPAEVPVDSNFSTRLPYKPDRASSSVSEKITAEPEAGTKTSERGEDNPEVTPLEYSGIPCQEGSENCSCSGLVCSIRIHQSGDPSSPESGNKRTDATTVSSVKASNEASTESTIKSSKITLTPLNDSECDSESEECSSSSSSEFSSEGVGAIVTAPGRDNSNIAEPAEKNKEATTLKNVDVEATTQRAGETGLPETIDVTEQSGSIGGFSNTETTPSCDSSGCATTEPQNMRFSDEEPRGKEENSVTTKTAVAMEPVGTIKEGPGTLRPKVEEDESSLSCDESSDDENCKSTDSSSEQQGSPSESDSSMSVPNVKESKRLNSATSEKPEGVTNSPNDAVTSIPTNGIGEEISTIEPTAGLSESRNSSAATDKTTDKTTECSPGSESGDCGPATTSSSIAGGETTSSSNEGDPSSSSESCESSDSCDSSEEIEGSTETNQMASINATTATAIQKKPQGSACNESSESCESSSSVNGSEICEDGSSGVNCTTTSGSSSSEPCDSSSGSCSSETSDPTSITAEAITTTTEATSKELEHSSTTIDNVSTTAETRRSTVSNMFLTPPPSKGRHRLALRIKVLLEHINENKEKEKLVQVEKHLLLNENPNEQGNKSLLWQIQSLNDTVNVETLKAIFNCSAFKNLSEDVGNLKEFGRDEEKSGSEREKAIDPSTAESIHEVAEENHGNSKNRSNKGARRNKRQIPIPKLDVVRQSKNITEAKATAIRQSLPGVEEDVKKGLDHVLSRISKELDTPTSSGVGKVVESSPSSILKLLASPSDVRIHSRRRRRANKVGEVMFVEQLKNPVKGKEIDRWTNERLVSAADGGKVRSVTEFKLLRDAVEDSRRVPLSS